MTWVKHGLLPVPDTPMQNTKKIDSKDLKDIYLFSGFDESQLQEMLRATRVLHLDAGAPLFHFGDPVKQFFFVTSGQIKLFRSSVDGQEKVIELVRPGETFAEAVMFMEKQGYPVSAEAVEESELLGFGQKAMLGILRDSVDTCFRLMAVMSRRLRRQVDEVDRLTLHNATFRLITFLLQQVPEGVMRSSDIQLTTPKQVVASRLSIQPETLSRILSRLNAQGLLEVHGQHIILRDCAGLRVLVEL